ncbi:MAG: prepilin-type N-terminal cleavage/methylation domain-containing protein [Pseudomonas sp.]
MTRPLAKAQRGLSLIELMIAMLISTFLVLGATQVYLDNQRTYLFQQGQSSNQNLGRMIQLLLDQQLARTGYRASPLANAGLGVAFPALASSNGCPAFAAGETVLPSSDSNGICFRYQGAADADDVDCLGQKIAASANVLSRISFVSSTTAGAGSLVCAVGGSSVTLVDGVADFVVFAVPNSDGSSQAVRYAALLTSSTALRDGIASSVLEQWKSLSGKTRSSDQYLYQISQGSVALRNLMP